MSDLDLTAAVEAAARGWFASAPFAPPWDDLDPMVQARARETVRPGVATAAPLIEAAVREQAAAGIEARQIICPIHHMPDCSPLLNGCSLPIHLHEQRAIDARLVRGADA